MNRNTNAQANLGTMYHEGIGVERKYTTAAKWYEKAATNGNTDAQYHLGNMYRQGSGVEQS